MYYAILGEDNENSLELRHKARPAHIARVQALHKQGRVLVAGPFPAIDSEDPGPAGFTGSLLNELPRSKLRGISKEFILSYRSKLRGIRPA